MARLTTLAIAVGVAMIATGPSAASTKPCRDASGRIVECPKTRTPSPRCKDQKGRFAACPRTGGSKPSK